MLWQCETYRPAFASSRIDVRRGIDALTTQVSRVGSAPEEGTPMSASTRLDELRLVRLPGEFGPILICSGELTPTAVTALERQLERLVPLGHPAITIDFTGCCFTDLEGLLALIPAFARLCVDEHQPVLVAITGTGRIAHALQVAGLNQLLMVFPDEEAAALALRGGSQAGPGPGNWSVARAETAAHWTELYMALDELPREEALRQATASSGLCEHAEEVARASPFPTAWRCQVCPLFYSLGARRADAGCCGLLDPVIDAIRQGNKDLARARIAGLLCILDEAPFSASWPLPTEK